MTNVADIAFGPRVAYNQSNLSEGGTFSQLAASDGLVMATVGQPGLKTTYLGSLEGSTTDANGNTTSFAYATGLGYPYTMTGKKGTGSVMIPVPGSFTMPVRKGETWSVQLTSIPTIAPAPQIEFYWIPSGEAGAAIIPTSQPESSPMAAAMKALRADLQSGKVQGDMLATAQHAIDSRVDDLAQILGDTVNAKSNESERQQFAADLRKIVCSATPPGQKPDNTVSAADLQALISTFGELAGQTFTPSQAALFEAGVRALVQINDNDTNRHDLSLIKRNVDLFLDNMQEALRRQLSTGERRLLTRALVRIVGDGTHGDR
jgi:hypothetical protein